MSMATLDRRFGEFSTEITRVLERAVVRVHGDVDLLTAPRLQRELADLIDGQGNLSVIVDLSGVTFLDSTGIHALIDARERMLRHGGDLILSSPTPSTLRTLEVCGLDKVFTITRV
jgi:anti-sigma B factor antagonist